MIRAHCASYIVPSLTPSIFFTRSFFCTACRSAALSSFCTHSLSLYLKNSHYVTDSHLFVNAFRPLTSSGEKYIKVKSRKACSKEQKENIFIHRHSLSLSPSHKHTHTRTHSLLHCAGMWIISCGSANACSSNTLTDDCSATRSMLDWLQQMKKRIKYSLPNDKQMARQTTSIPVNRPNNAVLNFFFGYKSRGWPWWQEQRLARVTRATVEVIATAKALARLTFIKCYLFHVA